MSTPNPEIPQDPTSDLQVVTAAYGDILMHNNKHTGFGAMFKGILKGMMESDDIIELDNPNATTPKSIEEEYKGVDDKLEEGIVEGDMSAELQDIFHSDTFMRAGIKIAPFGQFVANSEGKVVTSTELVPMIENTSLFTEFLDKLQSEDVQNEGAETFLSDVVSNLSKVVDICFDGRKHNDVSDEQKVALAEAGEDALRAFVTIDPEYARLGIDDTAMRKRVEGISKELSDFLNSGKGGVVPTDISDEYGQYTKNQQKMRIYEGMSNRVNYWGRGLLSEYLVAQHGQYLAPPAEQGFGPAAWQKDGGQYRWQEALDFLSQLEQDERTKSFGEEVRQGLVVSLDAALAELDDSNEDVYWRSQSSDLVNIRNALSGQQFDEARLTDYIKKPDYMS